MPRWAVAFHARSLAAINRPTMEATLLLLLLAQPLPLLLPLAPQFGRQHFEERVFLLVWIDIAWLVRHAHDDHGRRHVVRQFDEGLVQLPREVEGGAAAFCFGGCARQLNPNDHSRQHQYFGNAM